MNKGCRGDLPNGLRCVGGEVDKEFERDSKRQGSHLKFVFVFVFVSVFVFAFVFVFERDSNWLTPDFCHR